MKKRLESELISIAHRILKLKNKSEVDQLYHETQKLYETLSVLKFYSDNFEQLKLVLSSEELEEKINYSLENKISENVVTPQKDAVVVAETKQEKELVVVVSEPTNLDIEDEAISDTDEVETHDVATLAQEEPLQELENNTPIIVGEINLDEDEEEELPVVDAKDDLDFEPIFELELDNDQSEKEVVVKDTSKIEEEPKKQEPKQISFEDLLGHNYSEPVFVKPNDIVTSIPKKVEEEKAVSNIEKEEPKQSTLNDKLAAGINVGLNDRIAFVKNLFGDSNEDYNRVISQLNTFDTWQEAQEFIEDMVKPDYNDWNGKDEYVERFMDIVEKKFM